MRVAQRCCCTAQAAKHKWKCQHFFLYCQSAFNIHFHGVFIHILTLSLSPAIAFVKRIIFTIVNFSHAFHFFPSSPPEPPSWTSVCVICFFFSISMHSAGHTAKSCTNREELLAALQMVSFITEICFDLQVCSVCADTAGILLFVCLFVCLTWRRR